MSNKEKVTPIRNIKQEAQDLLTERRITISDMSNELSQSMVGGTLHLNALRNHPSKIAEKTGCEFDLIVAAVEQTRLANLILAETICSVIPSEILLAELVSSVGAVIYTGDEYEAS